MLQSLSHCFIDPKSHADKNCTAIRYLALPRVLINGLYGRNGRPSREGKRVSNCRGGDEPGFVTLLDLCPVRGLGRSIIYHLPHVVSKLYLVQSSANRSNTIRQNHHPNFSTATSTSCPLLTRSAQVFCTVRFKPSGPETTTPMPASSSSS